MAGAVLVTGGTGGIGSALVRHLSAEGWAVSFTWRSDGAAAEALADETGAEAIRLDLADRAAVAACAEALAERDASFAALVHNAGATHDALAATLDIERAAEVMQVNLFAFMALVKGVVRGMTAARRGRIVAIGALAAARGTVGNGAYAASKSALEAYVRTLAVEVGRRGVTANVVAPGWIDTAMAGDAASGLAKAIPAQRLGTAAEVAAAVGFLLRDGAAYVNGTTLTVDGGLGIALAASK
ncbi:SDR family oxidoreductase [Zavarzinia compransoris]|uniref:SDR family oxidoreductase n=1 Tax=Zavarzinia marina TaxID=2911065 RepID=UPI001F27403A|nr:SDR family oxidoreductase [Zavarzinia marina]MCF4165523.1 SDR family oxidoreductase [Zavarzinia marina]